MFVSIYSSYIVSSDAVFQKKFIYVVHCFWIPKIFVFWLKHEISSARASEQFLTKMQVCFNLLVLRCKFWYCIPKEVHLCCSLLLNSKNFRILTETGDIISPSIWVIFDKNSSLSLFKKKNGGSLQKFSNLLLFQH